MNGARARHLISANDLLHSPPDDLILLDVRVNGSGAPDPTAYTHRHVPEARFVDIDADLAGSPTAASGARPLPDVDALTATLRRWGVNDTSSTVVYDDSRSTAAARAWWVLRWAGLTDVRVLDGGLAAWVDAGGSTHTGRPRPTVAGTATAHPGHLPVATTGKISTFERLLDARPVERFHGPDGHIPGAVAAPAFADLDSAGRLLDDASLRARYRELGVASGSTATYCGSAVAAALQVLVLATIDVEAALYVGSFSQWTADPDRPVRRTAVAETV